MIVCESWDDFTKRMLVVKHILVVLCEKNLGKSMAPLVPLRRRPWSLHRNFVESCDALFQFI